MRKASYLYHGHHPGEPGLSPALYHPVLFHSGIDLTLKEGQVFSFLFFLFFSFFFLRIDTLNFSFHKNGKRLFTWKCNIGSLKYELKWACFKHVYLIRQNDGSTRYGKEKVRNKRRLRWLEIMSVIPLSPKTRRLMIWMTERKQVGGESRKGLSAMKIMLQGPTL